MPFFLRTGKRLGEQRRLLTIAFREPPRRMFRAARAFVEDYGPDHISFDLGDPGGITTRFLAKVPGPQMRLGQARMEFTYEGSFGTQGLEPYERLHVRRDARRPHAVHRRRGDREPVGGVERAAATTRRRCTATRPAPTGRRRCTS